MSAHDLTAAAQLDELRQRRQRLDAEAKAQGNEKPQLRPVSTDDRSGNILRPARFDDVVGQERAVRLMRRFVASSARQGKPLDHTLLVGTSGTGKSTLSHVIAHELGVNVYEVQAPVTYETLIDLRETLKDGDILRIEEIHLQAIQERRGKSASAQPEVLFSVMEDRVIPTDEGVLPYPRITVVGTTTDEGMLPDAFIARFPIRPHLDPYTVEDMTRIAFANATALDRTLDPRAARMFAEAAGGIPRQLNNFMRNASDLEPAYVGPDTAREVIVDLNHMTLDGLTRDQQAMMRFLLRTGTASVGTIATAIGKSRDQKAIQLRVEPPLIVRGYVGLSTRGRFLTPEGEARARNL